jgi:arginyl-tRNA--protein-N-Asp/Glu arginylyltransferase
MATDYLIYSEQTISDFTASKVAEHYNQGFIFGRRHRGDMYQTRSLRINLQDFVQSSENRRVLRRTENLRLSVVALPYPDYSWEIHQLGKTFYSQKFGDGTMSASKIKSLFTQPELNNFNAVFTYSQENRNLGYCIAYLGDKIVHYTYPFYETGLIGQTIGIAMMTKAIVWAKENGHDYIYLGSVADKTAKYKLQFSGLEWWDNQNSQWSTDLADLKERIEN